MIHHVFVAVVGVCNLNNSYGFDVFIFLTNFKTVVTHGYNEDIVLVPCLVSNYINTKNLKDVLAKNKRFKVFINSEFESLQVTKYERIMKFHICIIYLYVIFPTSMLPS